ncbi:REP element-mobilizing transposase RayT [Sinomicrobium oceani]|uniref:REP element-mobilizing transposase RayT n=1 Tax=Sinomicrobium oceani TaxID=1150368 RepID=A0A1K1S0W8_9FLAO|nr:transposase [Sinomicrobium oceani]SFW77709.1 REP element-mobilizing transposase RayT [Sinomicrobium oceani]
MPEGYSIRDASKPHFVTLTVVDWIDVFTRKVYKDCILDSLRFCMANKGMLLYGYVLMSNHLHMIVQSETGDLSGLLRDFKKFTAKTILEKIQTVPESRREWMLERFGRAASTHSRNKTYQFWKYGNHPEEVYSEKFLWSKLDYLHLNPVRAGIVERAGDYLYSSAGNYIHGKGVLEGLTLAVNPVVDVLRPSSLTRSLQQ